MIEMAKNLAKFIAIVHAVCIASNEKPRTSIATAPMIPGSSTRSSAVPILGFSNALFTAEPGLKIFRFMFYNKILLFKYLSDALLKKNKSSNFIKQSTV